MHGPTRIVALLLSCSMLACGNDAPVVPATPDGGGGDAAVGADASTSGLSLEPATLAEAHVGEAYEAVLQAAGGTAPYAFSLETADTLPAGLSLSAEGRITGTPTAPGVSDFTIVLSDGATPPLTATFARTITVVAGGLSVTTATLAAATRGVAYQAQLEASGGTAPVLWSLASGALPSGVSLDASGLLSGTPGEVGTFTFRVEAADAAGAKATRDLSLAVEEGGLRISTAALPEGRVGQGYSQKLSATGGTAPVAFTAIAGSLPDGIALASDGTLSGTPTREGTYHFTVAAVDSSTPVKAATASLALEVLPPAGGQLVITTPALPDGVVSAPYSAQLAGGGGTRPYTWSVIEGSLPNGLALAADGALSGTGESAGTWLFTVELRDASTPAQVATARLGITVLSSSSGLRVTTASLPGGTLGLAYAAALDAAGGTAPYSWRLASGALPPGLVLAADGKLAGTPSALGTFTLVVEVGDASTPAQSAQRSFVLGIASGPLSIVTSSLPKGLVGQPYSTAIEASGGQRPYSWQVVAGALPAGLSLDAATGVLAGTPAAVSSATFTVQAADSSSPQKTAQQALTLSVTANSPGLVITTQTLPEAVAGVAYSVRLTAAGGTPPYSWSQVAGALPAGLSLDSTGVIAGTPAAAGTTSITVRVEDAASPKGSATQPFPLTVRAPLQIATSALPAAKVGVSYSAALSATGGAAPYQFSLLSGSLPPGVTLAPDGKLAGIPTAPGVFGFAVQAVDGSSPKQTVSTGLSIAVSMALSLDTTALPDGMVGVPYDVVAAASGGLAPYTWSVSAGTLPAGLVLDAARGRISGTPSAAGDASLTLQVKDAAGETASKVLGLRVVAPSALLLVTTSLPGAVTGTAYSSTLAAAGGTAPYTWSVSAGALPAGLVLSSAGVISGTPTAAGTASVTIRVVDSSAVQQQASRVFTLVVTSPLAINTSLPAARVGVAYSATLRATGGTTPYSWSLQSGALPAGLSLDPSTGAITGTPTVAGTSAFRAAVRDASSPALTATADLSIVVSDALKILTASLPAGRVGVAYSAQLVAGGGTAPYTWTMASAGQSLPPGLSLAADGVISGTPTTPGTTTFTIAVTDAVSARVTRQLAIEVTASAGLTVVTASLPDATRGTAYSTTLAASGGTAPYTWRVSAGQLPAGLSLSPAGVLSGVPTASGSSTFTVEVEDSAGTPATATRALALRVVDALVITTASLPNAQVNVAYDFTLVATGGQPPYTWSVSSGTLPTGLNLEPSTGRVFGTPTQSGNRSITFRVTDSSVPAQQAERQLNLRVN